MLVLFISADGSTVRALVPFDRASDYDCFDEKGWDLAGTLIICDTLAIVINLVLGLISPAQMVNEEGPVVGGINRGLTV